MEIEHIHSTKFCAALPTVKKADFKSTILSAKKILGINNGLSILKIHSGSMPRQKNYDSGIGKLNSESALNFLKFITFYTGVNAIKEFPAGQTTKNYGHFYCPYLKTATTFGEENINLVNIIENKKYYGNILSYKDRTNYTDDGKNPFAINYELELGMDENYPILKPLRIAFNNYKNGLATPKFKQDFEAYKQEPIVKDLYPRLAIFPYVHKKEKSLFLNFDKNLKKQEKFESYKKMYCDEIEFFQFRQFLAKKEHNEAKNKINREGLDLFGDCLIGFSKQEVWAQPDAFEKNAGIGGFNWGLPVLKFKEILNPNSIANKVFDEKLKFFLENYDGIRFDVGWCYAIAQIGRKNGTIEKIDMGHNVFNYIEQRAKEIKGLDFDTHKLIYEMDGFGKMFTGWEENNPKVIPNVKNITNIITTEYQHSNGAGWGTPDFFKKTGLSEDELMMGTNNHDGANLRALSEGTRPQYIDRIKDSVPILSKTLKLSKQKLLNNPKEFVKAKFAQLYTIKNQFLFFIDVLGSKYDMDSQNTFVGNYRFRVDENYERQYHTALQEGAGFNLPEVLGMVMRARNLHNDNPVIYEKLLNYAKYLRKAGAKSEEEANLKLIKK